MMNNCTRPDNHADWRRSPKPKAQLGQASAHHQNFDAERIRRDAQRMAAILKEGLKTEKLWDRARGRTEEPLRKLLGPFTMRTDST